ncbi:hypothetical protein [Burkholderia sp. Ac-20365]|uniref:hypothetical protein n=1 Tax=Burkholderia sp. Ac-20365 TaxID=2703897 RepID=UPI00197B9B54|nr:hypothetical protein [Burkholderia sp. Ac-20365]MBN3760785.1 hypothetical protein [Burkholderia sp. Ac-20365]
MGCIKFHPPGLIIRAGARKTYRFAVYAPESGQEVHAGTDWDAAYTEWLTMRRRSMVVPQPLRVSWIVTEYGERHRPGEGKARVAFSREIRLLNQAIQEIGDPLVVELNDAHCQAFRRGSRIGSVRTETLIRRLRQVWRWAASEGLTNEVCPWIARVQDQAIQIEVVDIVARHLPQDILNELFLLGHGAEMEGRVGRRLSIALDLAVRRAIDELLRAGRPDLVPAARRCEPHWLIDHQPSRTANFSSEAELLLDHARVTHVREWRAKVRTRQKVMSNSNSRDSSDE